MTADLKQGAALIAIPPAVGLLTTTNPTVLYTVPSASTTRIATFSLTNKTGSAVTVDVSVVPSGQTVDGTQLVASGYSVPAHDSTIITEVIGGFYPAGTFISATAGTVNALCYSISGLVGS